MTNKARTRYAPSPTGYMHIGNLRSALYEYLVAKINNGTFVLRMEDTDQERYVEDAEAIIYKTLKLTGIIHDEGPDVGGDYGPYVQSQRLDTYLPYAKKLVELGEAYYCFCTKERIASLRTTEEKGASLSYDRHCRNLSADEVASNLENAVPYVIRQKMPTEGYTSFVDSVYGKITVENSTLDDQILIKSDGFPTYNFANVIDDHLMDITHIVRGSEYLSSTPKYTLLYKAYGWDIPEFVHLPLIVKEGGEKMSKRKGDASFDDLLKAGFLPEAVINYIALLGWSPGDNREIFSIKDLEKAFTVKGISKSPSTFDEKKLKWMNSEYIKTMAVDKFTEIAMPYVKGEITKDLDLTKITLLLQNRLEVLNDIPDMIDFFNDVPEYSKDLYNHKRMKTNPEVSLDVLKQLLPFVEEMQLWELENIHDDIMKYIKTLGVKNGLVLWPLRTALSGKAATPGGAFEIADILGKDETINRLKLAITKLENEVEV